jgi:hypothetical protein
MAMLLLSLEQEWPVNQGRTVFAQLIEFAPHKEFQRCVERYSRHQRTPRFSYWDQFLAMAFAQLTFRESLRDIEACLRAAPTKLYHMGFRAPVSRSTLADANERRDWRIYADFAQILIHEARRLYLDEPLGLELDHTVYALDATTIDLCLSVFPWARFRKTKSGIKLHTLLDLRGNVPVFIWITDAKFSDVRILDVLVPEPGSIYLFDRAYVDFARLHELHEARAIFVTRTKKGLQWRRIYSHPVDRSTGVICDQTIALTGVKTAEAYPKHLRYVRYRDPETDKRLGFLTNDFTLPVLTVVGLYRMRWQVELFFKWIKQNLRIKTFFGTSANAVKTQIWIAISAYLLVAIARKRLGIQRELYTMLQILSVCAFEKALLPQVLSAGGSTSEDPAIRNQLSLFDL